MTFARLACIFATTSGGVFAAPKNPSQPCTTKSFTPASAMVGTRLPMLESGGLLKDARLRLTVSNLANRMGDLNVVVGSAAGTYNTFPIPPRQYFLTFSGAF